MAVAAPPLQKAWGTELADLKPALESLPLSLRCPQLVRLTSIASAYGFSWEEESPKDRILEIADKPVPFDGCTITDNDGTRPMPIGRFIQSLRPCVPFRDIDSPPWEEERPIDEAERILSAMNGDKES